MIFKIKNIPIYFPYARISHEQISYIKEAINSFITTNNLLIEMPAGSGKTICILSAAVSYQLFHIEDNIKFIYCTRTVQETEKTLKELDNLIQFVKKHVKIQYFGLGLTSRKHLCINTSIENNVEIECRKLIFDNACCYYTNLGSILEKQRNEYGNTAEIPTKDGPNNVLSNSGSHVDNMSFDGVYTFEEIRNRGEKLRFCPYFFIRKTLGTADMIVLTYNYVLDPKIQEKINLPSNAILVFDEAHNIDNACIDAFSYEITRNTVVKCSKGLEVMEQTINKSNINKIAVARAEDYNKIKDDIESFGTVCYGKLPGNLRKDVHVLSIMKRILEFLKIKLKSTHLTINTPANFMFSLQNLTFITTRTLLHLKKRFSMMNLPFDENIYRLNFLVDFLDILAKYCNNNAFCVIFEPFLNNNSLSPKLILSCNDSRIAMQNLKFRCIMVTSGTLTPFDTYMRLLGITGKTVSIRGNKNQILIVSKGNDQINISSDFAFDSNSDIPDDDNKQCHNKRNNVCSTAVSDDNKPDINVVNDFKSSLMSSSYKMRCNNSTFRNYSTLIKDLCDIVPDGMIIFFPSYIFMHEIISKSESVIKNLHKLVFIETINHKESMDALMNYKRTIQQGRGAIMFCVARGKVSEGIDFKNEEGRCVLLIGVPFAFTESVVIKERLKFLKNNINISSFLQFDAMRHALQCLGRVVRGKNDYGLMVLADYRYNKYRFSDEYDVIDGLSIDMCVNIGKSFFRQMANREKEEMLDEKTANEMLDGRQQKGR